MPMKSPNATTPLRQSCNILLAVSALIFFTLLLAVVPAHAQLPAGTTDASQPQTQSDPLQTQANEALAKQDYPAALKLLTTLAEKNPNNAPILYNLGFTQDALDQTTTAEATYRRAITADPSFLDPHVALGLLLARNDRRTEAHAELLKATTLDHRQHRPQSPSLPGPGSHRPELQPLRRQRRTPPGHQNLPRNPGRHPSLRRVGRSLRRQRRRRSRLPPPPGRRPAKPRRHRRPHPSPAASTKARPGRNPPHSPALAKDPDNPTLNAQLASLYDRQNKPEQALPIAEKLHTAHPEDAAITRLLARLYVRNQQYDKALPLYAALSAAAPHDPTLLDDNADALIHLNRYAEAETLLQRAVANPDSFPTKNDLGSAASHLAFAASANNDPKVTLQALTLRATVLPNSPSSLFLGATSHDKLHHTQQAIDLYKQFLSVANGQFPNEEWEARHRLIALEHTK